MLFALVLSSLWAAAGAAPAANICASNATIGNSLLSVLNLTFPGLEAVAAAAARGDAGGACAALASYYASSNTSAWLRRPPPPPPSSRMAGGAVDAMVLHDIFYLAGVEATAHVPRNGDGGLDWLYRGPRDDYEFMNCLNRHDSFTQLLTAYFATGNSLYSAYFEALVSDWVLHNPCPGALAAPATPACAPQNVSGAPPCSWAAPPASQRCVPNPSGFVESPWRSLELGIRMLGAWPEAFFGFQGAANFSASGRALMLLGVGQHFGALAVDKTASGMANWALTQWQGLLTATVAFPELARAGELRALALAQLEAQLNLSFYPDGVETEQSSGYHMASAADFFDTFAMLARAGAPPPPPAYAAGVERMFAYGALSADPSGCLPRNGDTDVCDAGYSAAAAALFNRSDWTYAASAGARGAPAPSDALTGPSRVWPWSGQVVLRSGWGAGATWAWFDVGPYASSGHGDRDCLSLNLHARGAMLLVDAGRFAYVGSDLSGVLRREYQKYARAHNTLIFDGCDQLPVPAVARAPLAPGAVRLAPGADAAYGSFSAYDPACLKGGAATHTRGVWYQRAAAGDGDGDFLVVVDGVSVDRARGVEAFWHAHPNATQGILLAADSLAATVGGATARFEPTAAQACLVPARPAPGVQGAGAWASAAVAMGQARNDGRGLPWQGWFSGMYDDARAAPVATYAARVPAGRTAFAWLIVPTGARAPCAAHAAAIVGVARSGVVVQVSVGGAPSVNVSVAMEW